MSVIEVKDITNFEKIEYPGIGCVHDCFQRVSMKFETGNVYCINSNLSCGSWAISWLLAGKLIPKKLMNDGCDYVYWDGKGMSYDELKAVGFAVGLTGFEGTFSANKPVGKLLDKLVKNSSRVSTVKELEELFMLKVGKFSSPIRQYSRERMRATIAMGYAGGKRVFCFPWMRPGIISNYKDLWIKEVLKPLVKADCLVVIPTVFSEDMSDLFTKVAIFKEEEGIICGEPIKIKEFPSSYE